MSILRRLEQQFSITTGDRDYGARPSRGRHLFLWHELPLSPRRTAPVLQRGPDAAREPEAIDRGRRSQRLEAVQLDAVPLEAAFLQNVARRRIGDTGARDQVVAIEFLEKEIDHGACGLGAKPLSPIVGPEPIAEFRRIRVATVDADHADRHMIVFDQEYRLAPILGGRAHEFDCVVLGIGVWQAAGVFRNAAIIRETRNRFYVRERRPAQRQPFGLEDADSRRAQRRWRNFLAPVGVLGWRDKTPR